MELEPKKLKTDDDDDDEAERQRRRNLMAAAAEARFTRRASGPKSPGPPTDASPTQPSPSQRTPEAHQLSEASEEANAGPTQISLVTASELLELVFGVDPPHEVLCQWTSQGFRFSDQATTTMGLEQRQGGPCGVLAPLQAFVLKYLIFEPVEGSAHAPIRSAEDLAEAGLQWREQALHKAVAEVVWRAARAGKPATSASRAKFIYLHDSCLDLLDQKQPGDGDLGATYALGPNNAQIATPEGLVAHVQVAEAKSFEELVALVATHARSLHSPLGSLSVLFSALMSRGFQSVKEDRDAADAQGPLVTPQFGHSSQEVVSLLICGRAVSNVFDGEMDLGDGMTLMGITEGVEVGFITIHEAQLYCSVGERLKRPKWPLWVVGSESHYTVLYALETRVQDETSSASREKLARAVFDAHDKSGDGGFIGADAIPALMKDVAERGVLKRKASGGGMTPADTEGLQSRLQELAHATSILIWSDFWSVVGDGEEEEKEVSFVLFHLNGIAKKSMTGGTGGGEKGVETGEEQRVALCELSVTIPPKWTPPKNGQSLSLLPIPPGLTGNGSGNEGAVANEDTAGEIGSLGAQMGPQDRPDADLQAALRLSMMGASGTEQFNPEVADSHMGGVSVVEGMDDDADLQKALELSMQDIGGSVSGVAEGQQLQQEAIVISDSSSPRGAGNLGAQSQEDADLQEALRRSMEDVSGGSAGGGPEQMNNATTPMSTSVPEAGDTSAQGQKGSEGAGTTYSKPVQHAPLVDCIRTRWPRAQVVWTGPNPSIV